MQVVTSNLESNLTLKGQVTIPVSIRVLMGLKPGDKINFDLVGDYVKLKPASNLDSVYGTITPLKKKMSFKEMKKIALEDKLNAIY